MRNSEGFARGFKRTVVMAASSAAICLLLLPSCAQGADSQVGALPSSGTDSLAVEPADDQNGAGGQGAAGASGQADASSEGSSAGTASVDTTGAAKEYAATVEHIYSTEYNPEAGYRHATPEEAAELMQQDGSILVDVRGKVDWDYMHIPGSVPIAFNVITGDEGREKLPDKDQLIILYCDYGGMSKIAAEDLVYAGYTNVVEFNGLEVWDGPVEGEFLEEEGAPSVQGKDALAESGTADSGSTGSGSAAAAVAGPVGAAAAAGPVGTAKSAAAVAGPVGAATRNTSFAAAFFGSPTGGMQ